MNPPTLQTIRGYELRERIGAGGFGEVYRAYQPSVGREVAIKVILPQFANHPDFIRRFETEAQLVARLEHPHIVPLYDYWREPDGAYLVMRYLRGGNLSDSLQRGPWTPEAAARLLDQVAGGLSVAHRQGVVHRDIKPKNILLDEEGNAYLSDFGIAKELLRPTGVTGSGEVLGSPAYISPEQAKGERLTPQSDLYSLGVVMYQVLTGEHPFPDVTPVEQLMKHLTEPLPPLRGRRPDLPGALEEVIQRATAKDPAARFPDALAFAAAFRQALGVQAPVSGVAGERLDVPAAVPPREPLPPRLPPFLKEEEGAERPVFVARERELARLNGFLEAALGGTGQVAFVSGTAGRGKTTLVQEFARRVLDATPDMLVGVGNCNPYSGIGDPYLPFRGVLGMLTGDVEPRWAAGTITTAHARRLWAAVPQVMQALIAHGGFLIDIFIPGRALMSQATAATPAGADWLPELERLIEGSRYRPTDLAQHHLFDQYAAVLRALSAHHPLLLLLDDMQWADTGSTGLLYHLGRRLEGSRVLIVCAYRPDEVALGRDGERHPLAKVLAEFKRTFGDVWVDLAQAEEVQGRYFVDAFLDSEPNRLDKSFRQALFHHTGGHALFTVELLRDMQERGDLIQDAKGYWAPASTLDWTALPARVEAVIAERIGRLEDELREVLSIASVEGEDFTAQVVARVQEINERKLLRDLSQELEKRHRLVREQGSVRVGSRTLSRYRFAHALFQQYLYNDLGEGERVYLHEDVGTALEGLYGEGAEGIAAVVVQLAWHFQEAGIAGKAVDYLSQAGDQARRQYANEEAITYFRRALALLEDAPPDASHQKAATKLYEGLGDALQFIDRHDEARTAYQNALASLSAQDRIGQGRLHRKTGTTIWGSSHQPEKAMQAYDKAETALGQEPAEAPSEWWQEWVDIQLARAGVYYLEGRVREQTELVEKIRPVVEQHGTPLQHADFFLQLVLMGNRRDRFIVSEQTLAYNRAYLEAAQELGSLYRIAHARFVLGFNLLWRGEFDEAKERMNTALELMARMGDITSQTQCLTYLAIVYRKLGQVEEAIDHALRSLEAATWVQNPMYIGAARANLAWVAWRKANLAEALEKGKAALESWQQSPGYPFQWLSLYPLIAVALAHDRIPEAVEYARGLLEPAQQALPDPLQTVLEEAIETWERDEPKAARAHLDRALELAQELGYL